MRQKLFCLGFLAIISGFCTSVSAQTVEVTSLTSFTTEKPPKIISVKLVEPLTLSETQTLTSGTVMKGNLVDVVSPKRLKLNAKFSFEPTTYTEPSGETKSLKKSNIKATYTVPIEKSDIAKGAVMGVGNYMVKGFSIGVAAVSGAVKNEDGNRLKSSVDSAYNASPLSLIEQGEEISIKSGQNFFLKFSKQKTSEEENTKQDEIQGQNYSFTIEKE
jgi:hypothetical protein